MIAKVVIPESGLEQEEDLIIKARVEMRQHTYPISRQPASINVVPRAFQFEFGRGISKIKKQVRTPEHKHKSIRRRSINKIPRYQLSATTIKMADEGDHLTLMPMLISLAFVLRHKHNISIR